MNSSNINFAEIFRTRFGGEVNFFYSSSVSDSCYSTNNIGYQSLPNGWTGLEELW